MINHIIVTDTSRNGKPIHYYNVERIVTKAARYIETMDNIIGNGMKPNDVITRIYMADGITATWDAATTEIEFCND